MNSIHLPPELKKVTDVWLQLMPSTPATRTAAQKPLMDFRTLKILKLWSLSLEKETESKFRKSSRGLWSLLYKVPCTEPILPQNHFGSWLQDKIPE